MLDMDISYTNIGAMVSVSHKIRQDIDRSLLSRDIFDILRKYNLNQEGIAVKIIIQDCLISN